MASKCGSPVKLYAYSLRGSKLAYHLSISVFNREYTYGDYGIRNQEDKSDFRKPDEVTVMGSTRASQKQLETFIDKLSKTFNKSNYNVLSHNCQDFVKEILDYLGIYILIPPKYTNPVKDSSFLLVAGLATLFMGGLAAASHFFTKKDDDEDDDDE